MTENNYVIVKFTSGEQVMAVLESEDRDIVLLGNPMYIKTITVVGENKEHVTASPLCFFAEDQIFMIEKRNILFMKKIAEKFVPHFKNIMNEEPSYEPKDETSTSEISYYIEGNETIN